MEHCPQTGKIYIIIIFCLVFTSLLTSINILSKTDSSISVDDNLFGTGIAINIIQTMFTIYLIIIDLFGKCNKITTDPSTCGTGCKWYSVSPNIYKCTSVDMIKGYIYIPIILMSSAYLMAFGITMMFESNNKEDEEITILSISSVIIGAIGILLIIGDLLCNIGCYCS
jgi:hypothetical protein